MSARKQRNRWLYMFSLGHFFMANSITSVEQKQVFLRTAEYSLFLSPPPPLSPLPPTLPSLVPSPLPPAENLFDCPAGELGPIPHWEVGKFFSQFKGNRYCPNDALSQLYPDDL